MTVISKVHIIQKYGFYSARDNLPLRHLAPYPLVGFRQSRLSSWPPYFECIFVDTPKLGVVSFSNCHINHGGWGDFFICFFTFCQY